MNKAFTSIGTMEVDNLIAGNSIPTLTEGISLAIGGGKLSRGTLISTEGKIMDDTTVDKVQGILTDDVELSSTGTTDATIYIAGEFNSAYVTVGADVTVANFKRECRTLGIFIK